MSIHTLIKDPGVYFITFTCYKWLPLIEITDSYDLFYNWFDILTLKGNVITGYTIMPNHLHLLLYYNNKKQKLNSLIGNGKRFIAYEIIQRLIKMNKYDLIDLLKTSVDPHDIQRGKNHEIWERSFDVKNCWNEKFILQKLNYMHANPCAKHWKLSEKPYTYKHSSASFYECGIKGYPLLRDYRDFLSLLV